MDDLDYSIYIAEHDWSSFFQECEECDVLQASLASLDDSGLSDPDDGERPLLNMAAQPLLEALSVKCRFSTEMPQAAEDIFSCKKEDECLESESVPNKDPASHSFCQVPGPCNAPPRPLKSGLLVIPDEPQTDLQIKSNPELERTDYLGNSNEFPRKEKERWFVTMDIGQTRSRENVGTSGKKKKRKKRHSRSQSELGLGCGDWDPAIQSGSEAERCGDAEPRGQELPWELEGFQSRGETAVCTGETRHQFHSLWAIWQPNTETFDPPSSALSASEDTQPPTVVSKNVCVVVRDYLDGLLPQGQQSTTQQPDLTTVLPGTSDLECLNEIRTETDHVFQDGVVLSSGRKEKIHREDEQVMKTEELTQASSMQNLDIQKNLPPLTDPEDKELQDFSAVGPASTLTTTECCVSQEPLTLNPTYPVYAISSFWDEMEKLTIKDILHLRLVSHVQSPRDLPYNLTADPSDAADSDYFTLLDESKPDHPSSEFSTSSDFEEDFLQEINTSTDPSPEPPDQGPLHPVQSERENSCLYFLSHQESEQQFRSEPVEHTESVGKTCPTLFDSDMLTDSFNIPFSEIFKCSLGENEATFSPLDTSAAVCLTDENAQKLSVPEMYDYFFAEFETGSLFFPLSQRCDGNKMNSVRSDDEDDCKPVRVVTRANSRVNEPEEAVAAPDTYEQFCTDSDWKGNVFWRNPFSLRGTRFLLGGFLQPRGSSISWECPSLRGWGYLLFRRIRLGSQGDHNCHPRIGYLDKQTFTQEKEAGLENLLLSLQHADLCLVCIAFASWLLKSVNPQDADTWRTSKHNLTK
ncbi:PGC-1 and ERR-induced regulator in muscle protein 1 isoform X1 [Arapaima gigas]